MGVIICIVFIVMLIEEKLWMKEEKDTKFFTPSYSP